LLQWRKGNPTGPRPQPSGWDFRRQGDVTLCFLHPQVTGPKVIALPFQRLATPVATIDAAKGCWLLSRLAA
jgi:hypothetical protein